MRSVRNGLTLIEVLAASVLLGTLLATAVVSASRHTQQVRRAQDRLEALEIADGLLRTWLVERQGTIEAREGLIDGHDGWRWEVTGRIEPELQPLGFHVGILTIVDRSSVESDRVLAQIEFVSSSVTTSPESF